MAKFGQNDPQESCLELGNEGCLEYTTNLGNKKAVKLPEDKVTTALSDACELVVMVNGKECDREDLSSLADSTIRLEVVGNECRLIHTNAKGVDSAPVVLPGINIEKDDANCTVTVDDGKGNATVFYQGVNPETDIKFGLDDNKDLSLCYKNQDFTVVLPNFVTDVVLDPTNCTFKVFKWCDDEPCILDPFALLGLQKVESGGFEIRLKDQLCTFNPATLTQNPENPLEFTFDNQYGQTTTILLPSSSNVTSNEDGTATITLSDGTVKDDVVCGVQSTVVDNGDGTSTLTQNDGSTGTYCNNPVKTINGVAPDEAGNVDTPESTLVDNGDNTFTHTSDTGTPVTVFTGSVEDNGDGSGTVTDNAGNACVLAKGVTSTVVDNGDGTATITQNDGSTKNVLCAGTVSTVVPSEDGLTAVITQNDGSTHTVLCAPFDDQFSTTVNNGDGTYTTTNADGSTVTWSGDTFASGVSNGDGTGTITFSDGSTLDVCLAPCAVVADNADGTGTVTDGQGNACTFVKGVQSTVAPNEDAPGTATITQNDGSQKTDVLCGTPSNVVANAEGEGGGVGTATITQTDGTVKDDAVCGQQSTIVDNEDGSATATQNDGTECALSTTILQKCDESPFAKNEVVRPLSIEEGHAPNIRSTGNALNKIDQSCAPDVPECPIQGMRQTTHNDYGTVDWEWTGAAWKAIGFSSKRFTEKAQVLNTLLTDAMLSGAEPVTPAVVNTDPLAPVTLGNSWQTIAQTCLDVVNDDCVPWAVRYDLRAVFSGSIAGGNYWTGRVVGSLNLPNGVLNGTAQHRNDERCRDADGCNRLFDDVIEADSPATYIVEPGETLSACIDQQYRVNVHVPDPQNELGSQAFALVAEITRDCG